MYPFSIVRALRPCAYRVFCRGRNGALTVSNDDGMRAVVLRRTSTKKWEGGENGSVSSVERNQGSREPKVVVPKRKKGAFDPERYSENPFSRSAKDMDAKLLQREMMDNFNKGRFDDAFEMACVLSERSLGMYGDKHIAFASSLSNIGVLHKALGRYEEGIEALHRSIDIYKSEIKIPHPSTAAALCNLGHAYKAYALTQAEKRKDLLKKALGSFEESLELRVETLGEDSVLVKQTRAHLMLTRFQLEEKEDEEVESVLKETMDYIIKTYGEKTESTATAMNNLGFYLKLIGKPERYRESLEWYQKAFGIREKEIGPTHPDTLASRNNISELYRKMGREDDAELEDAHIAAAVEQRIKDEDERAKKAAEKFGRL